ncbi:MULTISPECIES: hypothetical protein [unclassified Paraburkholderia]|uniref:hypothetical protein n=1 Tax=unclassified Paraburkholderia TaxID=2615204 RepID=UPI0016200959|nr:MULTISPECIES: hypothetical protein [unclassified Paraburkholderia]MBB5444616.1 hypothetical protein [Paraburkholderia sp. WSM4177]MBB5485440.1 hypothetical protein [Paraburkholderia sp. WSM4180]
MSTLHVPAPKFTEETRARNEIDYFVDGGMTDAELEQYARRTTKRPLLCFAVLAAAPFIVEGICRLLGAW